MPANVETMAYTAARGKPWHGLGTEVDGLMTAAEAITAAGLDWTVDLQDIQTVTGTAIPSKRATVRSSDGSVLGIVGTGYRPIDNATAFDFADAIVADKGNHFETAGSLDKGRVVWLSIDLGAVEPIIVNGDPSPIELFLLLANAHDGSKALHGVVTPVRTVCENTLNLAVGQAKSSFTIRHSGDVESKLAAARDAIGITVDYARRFEVVAAALMDAKVTDKRATGILRDAFMMGDAVEDKPDSDRYANHAATRIMDRYTDAADLAMFRGTGWGLVNAAAEYVDHERVYGRGAKVGTADDLKMTSLVWGNSQRAINQVAALVSPKVGAMMDRRVQKSAAAVATRVK